MNHFALIIYILIGFGHTSLSIADDPSENNTEKLAKTVCAACHGQDGNSPMAMNPIIAQQHDDYLYKQLKNFKSGERQNAIMKGISLGLTDEDMQELSKYFSKFPAKTIGASDLEVAKSGEKIYRAGIKDRRVPACGSCHLPTGVGIPGQVPRVAGQYSAYTVKQLQHFKSGERNNDNGAVMRMIANRMTEEEIASVAEFIAGLR